MFDQQQSMDELIEICKTSILSGRNQTVVYNQLCMLVNQAVTEEQRNRIIGCIMDYQQHYGDNSFMYYCSSGPGAPPPAPPPALEETQHLVSNKDLLQPSSLEQDLLETALDEVGDEQEQLIRSIRTPYDFFDHSDQITRKVSFVFVKVYQPWKGMELPANPRIDVGFDSKTGERFLRLQTTVNCMSIATYSPQAAHALAQQHFTPAKSQPGKYVGRFRSFPNTFYMGIKDAGLKFATVENKRQGIVIGRKQFDDFFGGTITDALQKTIP
ncbi:MAG: hypothetical protein GXP25_16965 [Planctomycetes bacterium]|nr:hypothetical protein [Planctomycetota bacterium]